MPKEEPEEVLPDRSEDEPVLNPGVAFHLDESGLWSPEKVPDLVLKDAIYKDDMTILGYRCLVFETSEGDLWAQKINMTEKLASIAIRVAGLAFDARDVETVAKKLNMDFYDAINILMQKQEAGQIKRLNQKDIEALLKSESE